MHDRARNLPYEDAEAVALLALTFLTGDDSRLSRFLDLTGWTVSGLRAEAGRPALLASVLEHYLGDESLLLTFAAEARIDPSRIATAHAALTRAGTDC